MRAMSATGFTGYGDLKLVDLPKPEVADGKVLVRVTAAGVTPLDHTILSGHYPQAKAPLVLGNEGAGTVEGGGGTAFPAGSRVMFTGPSPGIAKSASNFSLLHRQSIRSLWLATMFGITEIGMYVGALPTPRLSADPGAAGTCPALANDHAD
jgi:NADPH:quinone reductase-like Zn-dependent oxidoreductase